MEIRHRQRYAKALAEAGQPQNEPLRPGKPVANLAGQVNCLRLLMRLYILTQICQITGDAVQGQHPAAYD